MTQSKKTKGARRKRIGVFVYCSAELRRQWKAAARERGQTLSGFLCRAAEVSLQK